MSNKKQPIIYTHYLLFIIVIQHTALIAKVLQCNLVINITFRIVHQVSLKLCSIYTTVTNKVYRFEYTVPSMFTLGYLLTKLKTYFIPGHTTSCYL